MELGGEVVVDLVGDVVVDFDVIAVFAATLEFGGIRGLVVAASLPEDREALEATEGNILCAFIFSFSNFNTLVGEVVSHLEKVFPGIVFQFKTSTKRIEVFAGVLLGELTVGFHPGSRCGAEIVNTLNSNLA